MQAPGFFVRADGRRLGVVKGFRDEALSYRRSTTPRPGWNGKDYAAAAEAKLRRTERLLSDLRRWGGDPGGARVLEVGCGDGLRCLTLALQRVREVVGVDLELPLSERSERGELKRTLARRTVEKLGLEADLEAALSRLHLRFLVADGRRLPFDDDSFDLVLSRSVLEHIVPPERAFAEMARVTRPGGLIHHGIDPYFWFRGCHKTGLVDIPWAHARLSLDEFHRFVAQTEGEEIARKRRRRLETLNHLTLAQWRGVIEAGPVEVLRWKEDVSSFGEARLREHPDVEETVLEGVERRDLLNSRINVWLRKREPAVEGSR